MTPALASKALQSTGVLCILGIALGTHWCLGTPTTLWSSGYLACSRRAASKSVLAQASLTIVGAGANRSVPVHLPLPQPLCLGLFGALAGQVPSSALFRVAINLAIGHPALLSHLTHHWQWMTMLSPSLLHLLFYSQLFWLQPLARSTWSWGCHADTLSSLLYACAPHGIVSLWGGMPPHGLLLSQGTLAKFGWECPPVLWQRRALSHGYLG